MLSFVFCYAVAYWLLTSWLRLPRTPKSTRQIIEEIDSILRREQDLLATAATCEPLVTTSVTVKELKAQAKELGLHGYSKLCKAELISLLSSY